MTEHKKEKAAEPKPLKHEIPDGAVDINDVKPGHNPTDGSPDPSDPTKLANPFNPISYITKPANPSNPANMPAMQSEKPPSEQRAFIEEQQAKLKKEEEAKPKEKEGNATVAHHK